MKKKLIMLAVLLSALSALRSKCSILKCRGILLKNVQERKQLRDLWNCMIMGIQSIYNV